MSSILVKHSDKSTNCEFKIALISSCDIISSNFLGLNFYVIDIQGVVI